MSDEVAVIEPPTIDPEVSEVIKEVAAARSVVKKLEVVALVATRFVVEASVE